MRSCPNPGLKEIDATLTGCSTNLKGNPVSVYRLKIIDIKYNYIVFRTVRTQTEGIKYKEGENPLKSHSS
jgi:hypothetical protein